MAVKNIQRRSINLTREVLKDLKTVSCHFIMIKGNGLKHQFGLSMPHMYQLSE